MKIKNLLTIPTLALVLAGCGSNNTTTPASEPNPEANALVADGVLTVGTSADFPPFEYYDGNDIVGIDPEIVNAIGEKLGFKVEFKDMEFSNILASLESGRVDMGAAGLTVTPEREKNADFTDFYAGSTQVFLVKKDNGEISTIDDIKGKKIGTQLGTVGDIYAKDDYGEENVSSFTKFQDAVLALQNGKISAILMDNTTAEQFQNANEDLEILAEAYSEEEYAFALAKGNEDFVKEINEAIKELKEDGTLDSIINNHLK